MNLIKPFDPWQNSLCSCPAKLSLSAYTGCSGGCLYCYASSYIRNFQQPRPKKDFLERLEKEVKKISSGSTIAIANSSDPYQPLEEKLKLTRGALEILKDFELKINLVTKSALILRDLNILKKIKKVLVAVSLTTLDEALAKKLEPKVSSPVERLKAVKQLSEYIPVIVRLDPLIYPLNTESIEQIVEAIKTSGAKQIITSTYKAKPDNFKRMLVTFPEYKKIWQNLYLTKGEKKSNYIYLPSELRLKLIKKVKATAEKNNLKFSSCREGLKSLNTASCDGSFFLR